MVDRSGDSEGKGRSLEARSAKDLAQELARRGEDGFRKKYPHPFLVLRYSPPDDPEEVELQTVETQLSDFNRQDSRKPVMKVVPLIKSNRNAFKSKITLGRARNNDVILRAGKVSKVHAAFVAGAERWQLLDMGSVNGTVVNGERLDKNRPVDLQSGDILSFWRYVFEYHDLDSFVAILRRLSKRKSPTASGA